MSMANDLALAISGRLAQITIANGYTTDIGKLVMRGRKRLDPSQLPCAVLIERDDTVSDQKSGTVKLTQKYVLEGHAECDANNPNDAGHKIIADIKRAIFKDKTYLDDRITFGQNGAKAFQVSYVGRTIAPREDGIAVVSAAVEIAIEYVEQLSNP